MLKRKQIVHALMVMIIAVLAMIIGPVIVHSQAASDTAGELENEGAGWGT